MEENTLKEIENLLNKIFIFEDDFKLLILKKTKYDLSAEKQNKLLQILQSAFAWQKETLAKSLAEDPKLFEKIMDQKRKIDKEIFKVHLEKIKTDDQKKIELILLKIKEL